MAAIRLRFRGEAVVALGIIALAALIAIETMSIAVSPGYARIGPRVVPLWVAGGLGLVGVVLLGQAILARWRVARDPDAQPRQVLLVIAGLAANILLIERAGFVIASTVLFVFAAQAFSSPSIRRDAAVGAAISIAAYLLFTRLLQLQLPVGHWWG